ncbi:thiosulfate sulfurtransferase GlpE [Mariprofundus micogutta]|uniref:Thiosulfate sulfurtransferase GlpE n=1 Tax=Mariprofundus micogutta TaxID=1921010 RepID=A0A1L8CPA1_9PROT|nr:rhodanese-like domain-containing protein [Mariprofundus micogutta]GAV20738.1 thiosulfate sulfurtransferase GlpE [Mariprofundus micogutta]
MLKSLNVNQLYPRWLVGNENDQPIQLIDVRSPQEYANAHVPGAKLISLNTLMARANEVPKQGDVYVICQMGGRSAQAISYLSQQFGFDNLINIDGGTAAWMQGGYPIAEEADA